jgi:hypothetical protein
VQQQVSSCCNSQVPSLFGMQHSQIGVGLRKNAFLARSCLDVNLDAEHHCAETIFIIRETLRAKSDPSTFLHKHSRHMALPHSKGRRPEEPCMQTPIEPLCRGSRSLSVDPASASVRRRNACRSPNDRRVPNGEVAATAHSGPQCVRMHVVAQSARSWIWS